MTDVIHDEKAVVDLDAAAARCGLRGVGALPRSDVPVPRLRRPRRRLRCGPHHPVSGGADAGDQPEMSVPKTPPTMETWLQIRTILVDPTRPNRKPRPSPRRTRCPARIRRRSSSTPNGG